ncbi:MAG: hypothetical protein R3228_02490 [Halioglobus sp.]|nr:hypothetical protein [Halioglobus sp.]
MSEQLFTTDIDETDGVLSGPPRRPRQMLQEQTYDGHLSIHDDAQAQELGFSGAPIEGPTHFSQFEPLLHRLWGDTWLQSGCISAHFKNVVVEGEQVQAFAERPADGANVTRVWATKSSGEPVLEGTASIGPQHPETELDRLLASRPTPQQLVILENVSIGDSSANGEPVHMHFDQHLGDGYPFTLADKLQVITEHCPWYTDEGAAASPWGRPIIPMEMISPLVQYAFNPIGTEAKRPVIGMFADLEIRLLRGPLFVGQHYLLDKQVIGLGESRRTESMWIRTSIRDADSGELVATSTLNSAYLKDSYPDYAAEAKRLGVVA